MAIDTIYEPLDLATGTVIADEVYTNVGSTAFGLGEPSRPFTGLTFSTGSGGSGTVLVLNTDYTLETDDRLTTFSGGTTIYRSITMINATYQTGSIYANYTAHGSYVDGDDLISRIDTEISNSIPVGLEIDFDSATPPTGYVPCNSTISDTGDGGAYAGPQYEDLFAWIKALGAVYGNTGSEVWGTDTINTPTHTEKTVGIYKMSIDQSTGFTAGNPVQFDTLVSGDLPSPSPSSNQITLPKGGVYDIIAATAFDGSNSNGIVYHQIYRVTSPAGLIGTEGRQHVVTYAAGIFRPGVLVCSVDCRDGDVTIYDQIITATNVTAIKNEDTILKITNTLATGKYKHIKI